MSKVNVSFNKSEYLIDKSDLEASTSALKNYLLTDMAGSGKTVKFDGVSYNIDAAKVAAAVNDFVSYLGSINGTGSKVVISGVEYSLGSDKLANAISELEAVLSGLVSGGGSSGGAEVDILPMITLTGFQAWDDLSGLMATKIGSGYGHLVLGETYMVYWDGTVYECIGQDGSLIGLNGTILCDLSSYGGIGNGEPFGIADVPSGMIFTSLTDTEAGGTHTVRIYQTTNSAPAREVVLAEQSIYLHEINSVHSATDNLFVSFDLMPNEEYLVVLDGVEYPCITQDMSSIWGGFVDENANLGLGNLNHDYPELNGNNEPFILAWFNKETAEKFNFGSSQIMTVKMFSGADAGEHTIAIYQVSNTTSPSLNKYGFLFEEYYSGEMNGEKESYVFFEDGSVALYSNGTLAMKTPSGFASYSNKSITVSGMPLSVSEDGLVISGDGLILTYEPGYTGGGEFELRWNGDTTSKVTMSYDDNSYYKVSDRVFTSDEFESGFCTLNNGQCMDFGDNHPVVALSNGVAVTWKTAGSRQFLVISSKTGTVTFKATFPALGGEQEITLTIPEDGTYFYHGGNDYYVNGMFMPNAQTI